MMQKIYYQLLKMYRSFFKILIIGLFSSVNISQVEVLRKNVFPTLEKNLNMKRFNFILWSESRRSSNDFKKDILLAGFVDDIREELIDCDLFSVTPKAFGFRNKTM